MSKRLNAKRKIERRLGVNLWGSVKSPYEVKNYPPGEHGRTGRRILSDFGKQLRMKQQLRGYYCNITEKQFRSIYKEATRRKGDTGQNLIGLLESRIDALVYRANFVPTLHAARQLVSHKHLKVNGVKVNVPSYRLNVGDVIELSKTAKEMPVVMESLQKVERELPDYIEVDAKKGTAKILRLPKLDEVPYPVVMDVNLVIEYYSR